MTAIERIYFGYYFCVRRFFQSRTANWLYKEKAEVVIDGLSVYALVAVTVFLIRVLNIQIVFPGNKLLIAAPIAFAILILNHRFFGNDGRDAIYSEYFDALSEKEQRSLMIISALATGTIFVGTLMLFYMTGQLVPT